MKTRWKLIIGCLAFCFMILVGVQPVQAANTKSVKGTCRYSDAYDVLTILNKKRTAKGLSKLTMDKELLNTAMLRAAEITVTFGHNRPNGDWCFTASDKMYAENIAYGYGNASAVMNGWLNSPGHYANMMNSSFKSVGIGCFYKGGVKYWVQCFGISETEQFSEPKNVTKTYKVALNPLRSTVSGFTATPSKRKLTLKWKKRAGVSGYQLQISTSKSFKSRQTYRLKKNVTSKTITKYKGKNLKRKQKYYVRIRAYRDINNFDGTSTRKYSKWKTISKKTK